jgi:hypothetical protein
MDTDFFKDIGAEWDATLDKTWKKLTGLDNLVEDADATSAFCDVGMALKGQCLPDIKKMLFILSMLLNRMEMEFSLDLSILDSFLMAALSPIFNALAANLDLINSLALDPIRCVLDYMQYQMNNAPRLAEEARAAVMDPILKASLEQKKRIEAAMGTGEEVQTPELKNKGKPERSEAEKAAEKAKQREMERQQEQAPKQNMKSALERANQAFNMTKHSIGFLNQFKEYLSTGTKYLEDKKKWLLNLIKEFVDSDLDRWDGQMQFARDKKNILAFISILKAMIDAAQGNDLSCGPDSDGMTEEDVGRIVRHWQHPSESLEIIVEDGNIVTRRRPDLPSNEEAGDRGIITGADGADSTGETLSNVVVRRPISSCLKKITTDEADQIQHWIRQLEQEV